MSWNMTITRGADFQRVIPVLNDDSTPTDLTGYTGRCQLRLHVPSPTPLVEFSTADETMVLDNATGATLILTAEQTKALQLGSGVHDLELTDANGVVHTLPGGTGAIIDKVTR